MDKLDDTQRFAKLRLEEFVALKVDQQIARICVWSAHNERIEKGQTLCELKGASLSEDDVYEIAFFFRGVWQIDVTREERKRCFLCLRELPRLEERLCHCFRKAQVARYIDPTPEEIDNLKKRYPKVWKTRIVETALCQNFDCKSLFDVDAGVVDARFRNGRMVWHTPKYCMPCFFDRKDADEQRSRPRTRRPSLRVPVKDATETTLQELGAKVAQVSPPPAES